MMDCYLPFIVTGKAEKIVKSRKDVRISEVTAPLGSLTQRIPLSSSINPFRGKKKKVKSKGLDNIIFGIHNIDLSAVEQIVDPSQVNAISDMILYALNKDYIDGEKPITSILESIFNDIEKKGMDIITGHSIGQHPGSYAMPRKFEAAAALNRLRTLKVLHKA